MRRVSVLGSAASSSRYRGANPPGDHRESGRPPTCSELACCVRRPPRVTIVVRRPPRVTIAVPTRGSALSVATPWCNASCRNPMRPATPERIVRMKCLHVLTARGRRAVLLCSSSRASSDYSPTGLPSGLKPELQLHSPPSQGGIVLGCMRVVRATS